MQMLRGNGDWVDCVASAYRPATAAADAAGGAALPAAHLVDWVSPGGETSRGDFYDLNHPLRRLRLYADGDKPGTLGALLPEGVLPPSVRDAAAAAPAPYNSD